MFAYALALVLCAVGTAGQFTNWCPRTTEYTYCPAFDYEDATVGDCPDGWTCEGDAKVSTYGSTNSGNPFFRIGNDGETGSATSDYFPVPDGTYDLRWERCGGADDSYGGVIIQDSEGNTICDVRDGSNTDTFFEQSCVLDGYAGQCIRIYTWDSVSGGWGKTFLDNFQFRDASAGDLESCSTEPTTFAPTMNPSDTPSTSPTEEPSLNPTSDPIRDCSLFHIDDFLTDCSSEFDVHDTDIKGLQDDVSVITVTVEGNAADMATNAAAISSLAETVEQLMNATTTMTDSIVGIQADVQLINEKLFMMSDQDAAAAAHSPLLDNGNVMTGNEGEGSDWTVVLTAKELVILGLVALTMVLITALFVMCSQPSGRRAVYDPVSVITESEQEKFGIRD